MRNSRFSSSFRGTPSLRRLKTAFSPVRQSSRSRSTSSSSSTISSTSPLTVTPSSALSTSSTTSNASSLAAALALRRKPSMLDLEMQEERRSFAQELNMFEPRPDVHFDGAVGGIFEVLDGRI
ncbi:hypothetical protein M501DRAFT_1013780 [Patellaria atrata CBS 101060]|uniref:Uncharacterized protein n=1 Tax=Patellaria atrata CBS 101060 TaxID=1346257 RepID=A0A9P4SII2_9PEZI|nr:hypothetical protein M501DRAFT_1013780 [Patellaria atrata CBS 101060]